MTRLFERLCGHIINFVVSHFSIQFPSSNRTTRLTGPAAEFEGDGGPPVGPPEGLGRAVGPLLWGLDRPEDVFVRSLDYCLIRRLFFVDMGTGCATSTRELRSPM